MRAAARVAVLVQRRPVEAGERPLVAREMRRHPVEDHADPLPVQRVDERPELVRSAEARGRREEAGHLVAPRARERVLHDRQQLDVREPELADVRAELLGCLRVGEALAPRAEMHLVDRDRLAERLRRAAGLEPVRVPPLVPALEDERGRQRRRLGRLGDGVGLEVDRAVLVPKLELVVRPLLDPRHEELPDPGRSERAHRVEQAVPAVEVGDDAYRASVRRPDGERRAGRRRRPPGCGRRASRTGARAGPRRRGARRARRASARNVYGSTISTSRPSGYEISSR